MRRHQPLATQSRRRLWLCSLGAIGCHLGLIGIGLGQWQGWNITIPTPPPVRVEFLDLDSAAVPQSAPALAARTAPVDTTVGAVTAEREPATQAASQIETNPTDPDPIETDPTEPDPTEMRQTEADRSDTAPIDYRVRSPEDSATDFFQPETASPAIAPGNASIAARRDPIWSDYDAQLRRRINQHWRSTPGLPGRQTKVQFVLDRQGELVAIDLLQPSGDATADQLALEAVRTAAPFAPLPPEASQLSLRVTYIFDH